MKKFRITLQGRDDATSVELALTPEQADSFRYLGDLTDQEANGDPCKPTLSVKEIA